LTKAGIIEKKGGILIFVIWIAYARAFIGMIHLSSTKPTFQIFMKKGYNAIFFITVFYYSQKPEQYDESVIS